MELAGILGILASFCTQVYRSFVFSFWQAHQILCFTHMNYSFTFSSFHLMITYSISPVSAWCHNFSLSILCYQAPVTDRSARQPCLKCKTPRYKGKCGVRSVPGTSPQLQPPATLPPAPCHLMLKVCSRPGTWHWEITHTGQLKSWEVNNSFITCSGWGLPVALWKQGQERV